MQRMKQKNMFQNTLIFRIKYIYCILLLIQVCCHMTFLTIFANVTAQTKSKIGKEKNIFRKSVFSRIWIWWLIQFSFMYLYRKHSDWTCLLFLSTSLSYVSLLQIKQRHGVVEILPCLPLWRLKQRHVGGKSHAKKETEKNMFRNKVILAAL